MKQTCFVVMGYGKKMDYATGKTVDLDKVYKTIIQPVVASAGYRCVRGDEVKDPSLIDRSMYALLMHAELFNIKMRAYLWMSMRLKGLRQN